MIKKILLSVFISISILCFFSGSLVYADTLTYGDYRYQVLDFETVAITKWIGSGTSAIIPGEIDGKSVTSIRAMAFYDCSDLTSITIPDSVTSIDVSAFEGCIGLEHISVAGYNPVYDSRNGCNAIIEKSTNKLIIGCNKTVIPVSVKSIGVNAFMGCSGLTSVEIPGSVTSIGGSAFSGCSGLTSIEIPKSVTSIGIRVFQNCSRLSSISVAGANTTYDSRDSCNAIIEISSNKLISGCKNTIIPDSVTSIGEAAFEGCSGLTSVEIPGSVTSIEQSAFHDCSGLMSIAILNGVTSIEDSAFEGCTGLTSVAIPRSVTSIDVSAFKGCTGLTSISVAADNTKYDSRDNCNAIIDENTLIVGCKNTIIPNGVTSIGKSAFHGCSSLTSIAIPDSVKKIEKDAFHGCSSLTSIAIPDSVKKSKRMLFMVAAALRA